MNIFPKNTVLLQDHMHGDLHWIVFIDPVHVISAQTAIEVESCLLEIETYLEKGYYVAGYLAYEASQGIDPSLRTDLECGYPVLWFGVYSSYREFDIDSIEDQGFSLGDWEPNISSETYSESIESVKNHIRCGNTYQVNFTFRLRNSFSGDPLSLAKKLFTAQSSEYCAYINLGDTHICSASPELFFQYDGNKIMSRPMKGTVKRGVSCSDDNQREEWLRGSIKNRAENVMIVDMIRNDMGRFANAGSVRVDQLFSIERYPTVFQMTSTVSSVASCSSVDVVRNMFPCASITGAPKVRTMEIIHELEQEPRGVYTGSIGYFSPDNRAQFNVAIRTVVVDVSSFTAEYGVGGGIVWDSQAVDEFNECKIKAQILTYREPAFQLLESLLWTPARGFMFLDRHLDRMEQAAQYFGFRYSRTDALRVLNQSVEESSLASKIRLTLDKFGAVKATLEPINSVIGNMVFLSDLKTNTQSGFVYHKTTNRRIYNETLAEYPYAHDVILVNEQGMVTESCIANLVLRKGDRFITPDIKCGLLNGVYRSQLVEEGKVSESCITPADVYSADDVFLVNSVRGWMKLESVDNGKWRISREFVFDFDALSVNADVLAIDNIV